LDMRSSGMGSSAVLRSYLSGSIGDEK